MKYKRIEALKLFEYLQNEVEQCDMIPYTTATITGLLYAMQSGNFWPYVWHFNGEFIRAMIEYFRVNTRYSQQYKNLLSQYLAYEAIRHEQPNNKDVIYFDNLPF